MASVLTEAVYHAGLQIEQVILFIVATDWCRFLSRVPVEYKNDWVPKHARLCTQQWNRYVFAISHLSCIHAVDIVFRGSCLKKTWWFCEVKCKYWDVLDTCLWFLISVESTQHIIIVSGVRAWRTHDVIWLLDTFLFSQKIRHTLFPAPHCYLPPPQVPISYVFKLAVKYIVCSQYTHVCRCLCVRMCMYAFRTVCIPGR